MLPLFALTSSLSPGSRNLFVRMLPNLTRARILSPWNWLTEVASFSPRVPA
jgi:hypothetical protein